MIRFLKVGAYALLVFSLGFTGSCVGKRHSEDNFYTLIIADTHVSNDEAKDDRIASFIDRINDGAWSGVELLINLGDVVSSVYDVYDDDDPLKNVHRLAKADSLFEKLECPYYFVMGNHDYKIEKERDSDTYFPEDEILQMEAHWNDVTEFDPYYSVVHKGWKFVFLNSMRGRYLNRHFDPDQLNWLEEEFAQDLPAILNFHHPLHTDNVKVKTKPYSVITPEVEPRFYRILEKYKDRIKAIFVGHGHRWMQDRLFGTIPAYMVASFGDSEEFEYYLVSLSGGGQAVVVNKNVAPRK